MLCTSLIFYIAMILLAHAHLSKANIQKALDLFLETKEFIEALGPEHQHKLLKQRYKGKFMKSFRLAKMGTG